MCTYSDECWGWLPNSTMTQPRRYPRRLAAAVGFLRCISFFRRLSGEWIWMGTPLGAPRRLYLYPWEPWGVLHLALQKISLEREANLVSIKSTSPSFFVSQPFLANFISPTSGLQIIQIRCLNFVPWNYLQLWYLLVSLEMKIRSQKRP
jgi:hypothetical protein